MKSKLLLWLVLLLAVMAGGLVAARLGYDATLRAWAKDWLSGTSEVHRELKFQVDLVDRLNYSRIAGGMKPLMVDAEMESWLDQEFPALATDDLGAVTKKIQEALPRYFRVSVCTATGPTLGALLEHFADFAQQPQQGMTHVAMAVRPSVGGLARQALLVVGQRLLEFSPEVLTASKDDAFFSRCVLCRHPHVVRISHSQRSMGLECPGCRRTYAVVAADGQGRFRYVNEFLSGYAPPAVFSKEQSRIHELFTIWSAVHANCAYTKDPGGKRDQTDSWQTSIETQKLGAGDCEDSSIFLCDWLLTRGFQARVALGRYGDLGGHAWCVAKLDDKEYLLESTEGRPDIMNPPLVTRVGSRYVPEVMFDRFAIYVRAKPSQTFNGDYWSTKNWIRVEPRKMLLENAEATLRNGTRMASAIQTDPDRMAATSEASPAAAPFLELSGIPRGADVWQVPLQLAPPDLHLKQAP